MTDQNSITTARGFLNDRALRLRLAAGIVPPEMSPELIEEAEHYENLLRTRTAEELQRISIGEARSEMYYLRDVGYKHHEAVAASIVDALEAEAHAYDTEGAGVAA